MLGAGRTVAGGASRWRKVRTPQGRVLVNGQAQQVERPRATESGTENRPPMAGCEPVQIGFRLARQG
jgi:hypothetical protein